MTEMFQRTHQHGTGTFGCLKPVIDSMNQITLLFSLFFLFGSLLLAPRPVFAQFGAAKIATATTAANPAAVARGSGGVLRVTLRVKPAYHINANKPNDPAYLPTVFSVQPTPGFAFGVPRYPAAQLVKVSYSAKPLLVYRGQVTVLIPFTVTKTAGTGTHLLTGTIFYQGCDAKSCYPPASAPIKAAVMVR